MLNGSNLIYIYDGSFEGLLCCIFESFLCREIPIDIVAEFAFEPTLYECKTVLTEAEKAARVKNGICRLVSAEAFQLISDGYLTCHPKKEKLIVDYSHLAINSGRRIHSLITNDTVDALQKAVLALSRESHQLKGFVRFSIYEKVMAAVIEPNNFVLPKLAPHFCDRYHRESFMIYDKSHLAMLIYSGGKASIVQVEDYEEPEPGEEEKSFRSMWKMYYDTIAIKERENPRCRMNHMQKRYWSRLTEMDEANNRQKRLG